MRRLWKYGGWPGDGAHSSAVLEFMPGESEPSGKDTDIVRAKASAMRALLSLAPLPLSDMELRIIDQVVFELGGQAVDQRCLHLGREQIGIVYMGLIGGHGNLVSIRAEGGNMSGG